MRSKELKQLAKELLIHCPLGASCVDMSEERMPTHIALAGPIPTDLVDQIEWKMRLIASYRILWVEAHLDLIQNRWTNTFDQ